MRGNRIVWLTPQDPPSAFPDIGAAMHEPDGLLAAGGDLGVERLLYAYRKGIFPWFDEGQPILWWSPDPRCVLRPGDYHVSRRLRRSIRKGAAVLTVNRSFSEVIRACAGPRRSHEGTWITTDMIQAFEALHANGWAHSIEVRENERLIGGVYGIAIGRMFFGESMFSTVASASKLALLGLCHTLARHRFELLDCQVVSGHLLTLGATTIPRDDFAAILKSACAQPDRFDEWPASPLPVREFLPT